MTFLNRTPVLDGGEKEDQREVGPTYNQRRKRKAQERSDRWYCPTVQMAICQHVSTAQPSHLLLTVSRWIWISLSDSVTIGLSYSWICSWFRHLLHSLSPFFGLSSSASLSPLFFPVGWPHDSTLSAHSVSITLSSLFLPVSLSSFHLPDIREKKRESSSLIGQRSQHPQLRLTVLSAC